MIDIIEVNKEQMKKDCLPHAYTPMKFPKVRRIVAIGDIHGDMRLTLNLLKLAKVIHVENKIVKWIGCDTYVVQIGDQLDSCRPKNDTPCFIDNPKGDRKCSDIKVLKFFTKLDEKAQQHGGRVISLLGNHEILNVLKQSENYLTQDDIEYFGSLDKRYESFQPKNVFGRYLGCTRLLCVIIGSNFFCHGGLIKSFFDKLKKPEESAIQTLEKINNLFKQWLIYGISDVDNNVENMASDMESILWSRILGKLQPNLKSDNKECQREFYPIMEMLQLKNMVIGHTPQIFVNDSNINSTCDNRLWRVDNALSNAFNEIIHKIGKNDSKRKYQVLEIIDDTMFNILTL